MLRFTVAVCKGRASEIDGLQSVSLEEKGLTFSSNPVSLKKNPMALVFDDIGIRTCLL